MIEENRLTGAALKWIAIPTMLIDHIGYALFPGEKLFRIIGRLSFPIFIFLLIEGFYYTSNRARYLLRLSVFALLSEVPYDLAFHRVPVFAGKQNVFFTLAIGFAVMWGMKRVFDHTMDGAFQQIVLLLPIFGLGIFIGAAIRSDYGATGVAAIAIGYMIRRRYDDRIFSVIMIVAILVTHNLLELCAIPVIPLCAFYGGKKGRPGNRWFYYCFYPGHLLILYLLGRFIFWK